MDKRFAEPYSNPRWWWWEGNHTPHCFHCSHFRGRSKSKGGAVWCLAFPDGIPDDLLVRKDAYFTYLYVILVYVSAYYYTYLCELFAGSLFFDQLNF